MKSNKLTFCEALMLVAGAGIGTGILTIPYAIAKIGIFGTLLALTAAYAVSAVMYLMIADLTLHSKSSSELLGILDEHLFRGRSRRVLKPVFFAVLVLLLLENLVVYILCASDVINDLLGIPPILSKLIFYLLASSVIFGGIKGMGRGEKLSVGLIGSVVVVLTIFACFDVKGSLSLSFGQPDIVFAVYGLFMFTFSAIFSVIQVCNHIEDPRLAGKAVVGGLTLNAAITLLFTAAVIIGSEKITEIATIGLADSIGIPFIGATCSVFVILAMLSSFWSSGFAFADVVSRQLGLGDTPSWFIATLPTVIIAALLPLSVLDYVQIGAGALSLILVTVVIPAYSHAVKAAEHPLLGRAAQSRLLLGAVAAAVCLMAVSSFIPID